MHSISRNFFAVAVFAAYAGLAVWCVFATDKTVPSIILSVASPALLGGATALAVFSHRRSKPFWGGFSIWAWGCLVFERAWPRSFIRHDVWLALPNTYRWD